MTRISLTVNGEPVEAEVEPRTHLGDFLREARRLTGTHLGCEHGVCGACTVEIDGAPARACITLAVACAGAEVRTIEGFDDDPLMARLRDAFASEHALQCGYCTPGMLIAARDVVQRLPGADEARLRRELEGNLCRCTGYVGIVRAVRSVIGAPAVAEAPTAPSAPDAPAWAPASAPPLTSIMAAPSKTGLPAGATRLSQDFAIRRPTAEVWALFRDIEAMAGCMPGAELTGPPAAGRLEGRIAVGLGPIRATFAGTAEISFDDDALAGTIAGSGRDGATGSGTQGEVAFALHQDGPAATRVEIEIAYTLSGALAQFGRGAIAAGVAQALTDAFAANLEARLAGAARPADPGRLRLGPLILQALRAWLARLFGGGR